MIAAPNISGQVNRTPPAHMPEVFLLRLLEAANSISRLLQMKTLAVGVSRRFQRQFRQEVFETDV